MFLFLLTSKYIGVHFFMLQYPSTSMPTKADEDYAWPRRHCRNDIHEYEMWFLIWSNFSSSSCVVVHAKYVNSWTRRKPYLLCIMLCLSIPLAIYCAWLTTRNAARYCDSMVSHFLFFGKHIVAALHFNTRLTFAIHKFLPVCASSKIVVEGKEGDNIKPQYLMHFLCGKIGVSILRRTLAFGVSWQVQTLWKCVGKVFKIVIMRLFMKFWRQMRQERVHISEGNERLPLFVILPIFVKVKQYL